MQTMAWQDFEPILRDRLTRHIEAQPELLLEHTGGPEGLKADVILATLYGFDEQVDAMWRVPRVESVLLRPLPQPLSAAVSEADLMPMMRTARYDLQSNWATLNLDWLHYRAALPPDVRPAPGTLLVSVAMVRYRRTS